MSQNNTPNPATDGFDIEALQELERKEADYPKKTDGSVDIDSLTSEQAASYWKDRHDASTRGFHSFKNKTDAEKADLAAKLEALEQSPNPTPTKTEIESAAANADTLEDFEKSIPNFDLLDPDTQGNLRGIFQALENRVFSKLNKDPGVAFARQTYADKKWSEAFDAIAPAFGEDLIKNKADFKSRYFQPNNVPDNIGEILTQLAKSYLFDAAKEAGAAEEREKNGRIDLERGNGGPKAPTSNMTIDDWEHLRMANPKAFAARSKEYDAWIAAGNGQE